MKEMEENNSKPNELALVDDVVCRIFDDARYDSNSRITTNVV